MVESRWNENDDIIIIIIIIINGQNKRFLFERILVFAMSELCVTAIQSVVSMLLFFCYCPTW
jgi:hypothetical protein